MAKQITDVADLPGVGEKTAEKLKEAGFVDIMAIAASSPKELEEAASVGEATAIKMIEAARETMNLGFETATKVLEKRMNVGKITTGSKTLNELLGGGVETGAVTEFHGAFGSSKSQVAHQLAVNVQLPYEKGGLDGNCIFIDTEATFRPERIKQMAEALGMDSEKVLENILVARAFNSDHQIILVEKAGELIRNKNIKLVIVDSVTSQFRVDFSGRGELSARQQKLNRHLHTLQRLADVYNVAIYVTNQVMANPGLLFGDPTTPIGGHIMGHFCLPADTLVQFSDGSINTIDKSLKTSSFLSFDMFRDLKKINASCSEVFLNTTENEILEIKTNSIIKATPKHSFFVLKGFDLYEKEAQFLEEGEYIAVPKNIDVEGEIQELPKIEVQKLVKLNENQSKLIKECARKKKIALKRKINGLDINARQLRRILNQGYPTFKEKIEKLTEFLEIPKDIFGELELYFSKKYRDVKLPEKLDKNLAQCLGYFLGDGNFEESSIRLREQRKEVIKCYKNMFEKIFNIETKLSRVKDKDCWNLSVNSIAIKELFEKIKNDYLGIISRSPKDVVSAFIKGFFDAEGYVSKKDGRIVAGQMKKEILDFIQMLLLRFGIKSAVEKAKIGWLLGIHGYSIRTYHDLIGLTSSEKIKILEEKMEIYKNRKDVIPVERAEIWKLLKGLGKLPSHFIKHKELKYITYSELKKILFKLNELKTSKENFSKLEKLKYLIQTDIGWQKIKRITKMKNSEILYDITIPEAQNFIANSCLVHNSTYRIYVRRSKAGTRIARMVDSPNLPEGECIFLISEKGVSDVEDEKKSKKEEE